jgi:hypothetical protein
MARSRVDRPRFSGNHIGVLGRFQCVLIPGEVARESGMMSPTNPI